VDKSLRALLDQTPIAEIDAYLKTRRRDEYLSKGAVDGWERTSVEIEITHAAVRNGAWVKFTTVILEEGAWVWRDEHGEVRRAFGSMDNDSITSRSWHALTLDEQGEIVLLCPIEDLPELKGADLPSFISDAQLAQIRRAVDAAPITRERA